MPELTDRELDFGYWYFLHRGALRRALIGLFIVAIAALWAYAGWQLVDWLATRRADDEAIRLLVTSTVNTQDYLKRHQPVPLEIGTATAVPSGAGTFDLVAEVRNPNPTWGVRQLNYTFTVFDQTFTGSSFFLPLEDKYLVSLGAKFNNLPADVSLSVTDVSWQRIRDLEDFSVPAFSVAQQKLEQLSPLSPGRAKVTRLRFDLTNDSASSFWRAGVVVVLMSGHSPQAVGQQVVESIASGSTHHLEFVWPSGVPPTDRLVVKPEVNLFDPDVVKAVR